jgi:L-threonylcarbamoyladenylate synthase
MDMICRYVKEVPEMAIQLVEVNDRPMTIIYPGAVAGEPGDMKASRHCLAFNTVASDGTVGIRIPMMDFCQQLVAKLGRPLVSTSANISGESTPARFAEISNEVKSSVDHIVDPSLEKGSTGQSSSIIKVGLDYSIEIIRK